MLPVLYAAPMVVLGSGPSLYFRLRARGRIHEVDGAPFRPVALVLGAQPLAPLMPTTLLLHRLEAARALLARGAVERLLLTGLGGPPAQDEVSTMRRWLLDHGAPEEKLLLDPDSPRTIASVRRAREVFGLREVSLVTNPYHLPRALFLAQRMGLDAIGVAARPGLRVSTSTMLHNHAREAAACLKAVWDCVR